MIYLLQQLLTSSARRVPERIAVRCKGDEITYRALDEQSDTLAAAMVEQGLEPGERVGIFHAKSIESIVTMMAVLKAGGVYVPIDPLSPAQRAAYIIDNCAIGHLVTSSDKLNRLIAASTTVTASRIYLTDTPDKVAEAFEGRLLEWGNLLSGPKPAPGVHRIRTDLAYILYTSGSTGQPKGVMISHQAALTFIDWAFEEFEVTQDDRVSNHAPLHFDLSVFDVYVTFRAGGCLVLVPHEYSTFPTMLTKLIAEEKITIWYSVPSALILMMTKGGFSKQDYPDLRLILFAGEVFPIRYLRELRGLVQSRLCNLYGPTETNVCTFYDASDLEEGREEPVPIGKAIMDYDVFALTKAGALAGPDEEGELCARGPGLMSGYWGDEEKTGRLLVRNPLQKHFEEKIYRTGDLVRLDSQGNYHYISRIDNMIKSRGYRIELGEIEAAIYSHPDVVEAVVVAVPYDDISNRIIAFVVTDNEGLAMDEVLKRCRDRLPRYMVPESLETRQALPKTSTGKIDRNRLISERENL